MIESKFAFLGKIFLISFLIINLPNLFPVNLFNVSYIIILSTTILDTSTLLVLSLSISKFVHTKNLIKIQNLNNQDSSDQLIIDRTNSCKKQLNIDNKLAFILSIFFAFITLIQPIVLIFDINKQDIYSGNIINSINQTFNDQKNIIEELILKEKSQNNDKKEVIKLENRIINLTKLKDKQIQDLLNNNNNNKFRNVKILIRNFLLGALFIFCFYKIYRI